LRKLLLFLETKNLKNLKFGLSGVFGFFKKPKKPRFFKSDFYSPEKLITTTVNDVNQNTQETMADLQVE